MRTHIATIATIVVAATLLAGCSGAGSEPTPSPSPSPLPSPAASPSAAAVPSPSPSPVPTTDGEGPERVVGTVGSATLTRPYDTTYAPGGVVRQLRNGIVEFTFELNDPRVTGTATWGPIAVDAYDDVSTLGPEWGPFALKNAGGTWEGTCSGGTWATGDGAIDACWLTGSGGHAGWTFYMQFVKEPPASNPAVVSGIIYPGAPPSP